MSEFEVGGEAAVIRSGWGPAEVVFRKVARVGKASVWLDDGSRWKRSGPRYGADSWSRERIEPRSAEHDEMNREFLAARRANSLRRRIDRATAKATLDQLEAAALALGVGGEE